MQQTSRFIHLLLMGTLAHSALAQFSAAQPLSLVPGAPLLHAVDLDADSDLDLLGLVDGIHFRWHANTDGAGDFSQLLNVVDLPEVIGRWRTGDVNGDGRIDIIYLDPAGLTVHVLNNLGDAQFSPPIVVGTLPSPPGALELIDVTGEGFPDLVLTLDLIDGGGIGWLPNSGTGFGSLVSAELGIPGPASTLLRGGDVDEAGGIDLVLNSADQVVFAVRNTLGDASVWQTDTLISASSFPYTDASVLIDVDNDGDLDLAEAGAIALHWAESHIGEGGAWSVFTDNELEPWTGAGNGAFGHLGCNEATAAVFVPSFQSFPVRWTAWTTGLGAFAYSADLPAVPRGSGLVLADLTGDGRDDLVLNHDDGAAWYRNELFAPTTNLELPPLDTLCKFGPPVNLPDAIPAGGRWDGFVVDDGIFYRSNVNGTGDYALTHVLYESAGCPVGASTSIFVTEQPVLSPPITNPLCSGQPPIQINSVPLATDWVGLDPDGILDPATFSNGVFVALFTDATGETCATESEPIEIWTSLPATIAPVGPFCVTTGPQLITASANPPFGVSWSGDITGWNSSGATFDPGIGAGTYSVILLAEPTLPFQCPGTDTLLISVSDLFPVVQTFHPPPQCSEGTPVFLGERGIPAGGIWNGPGVVGDTLFPALLAPGTYFLTYSYFDPLGCAASEALEVELVDTAIVSWTTEDLIFCETDEPTTFLATPQGGSWSAPLAADGLLSPGSMSIGVFPLVYTWFGENGCTLVNEVYAIERWATSTVVIDPVGVLCDTDPAVVITGSPAGTWSEFGSGTGSSTVIEPSVLGVGIWPVTLTGANSGECPGSTTLDLTIELCTGLSEAENASLAVSPNPFTSWVQVDLGSQAADRMEVFDSSSRLVLGLGRASGRKTIDLSGLLPGTYLLRVVAADGSLRTSRLVKL